MSWATNRAHKRSCSTRFNRSTKDAAAAYLRRSRFDQLRLEQRLQREPPHGGRPSETVSSRRASQGEPFLRNFDQGRLSPRDGRSGFIRRDVNPYPNLKRWHEATKRPQVSAKVHEVFVGFAWLDEGRGFRAV